MKLITIRSQILEVLNRWKKIYTAEIWPEEQHITKQLEKLDLKVATAKNIKNIIGNSSWAKKQKCNECGKHFKKVVMLGEKPDYGSYTAYICKSCLKKALRLIKTKQ